MHVRQPPGSLENNTNKSKRLLFGTTPSDLKITPTQIILRGEHFLWYDLDDEDDKAKEWFIDGAVEYRDTVPGATSITKKISRDSVQVVGRALKTYGGHKHIAVEIDDEIGSLLAKESGTIVFKIDVHIVGGFSGGFFWDSGDMPFITCSTRSWWEDNSLANSDVIWNHEMGHRIGMVAYGDKDHPLNQEFYKQPHLPDAPSTLYGENPGVNDKGHQGPHCGKGVTYDAARNVWSGIPGCVMFGATGTMTALSPPDYCEECSVVVQKIDLS